MPRKIKKKKNKTGPSSGKVILITTGIIMGIIVVLLIVLAIVQIVQSVNNKKETESSQTSVVSTVSDESSAASAAESSTLTSESSIPDYLKDVEIDAQKTYYADIDIKDYGKITVQLDPTAAPITVRNFIYLANSGFYDGLTFHRIMEGFMMQGGDPKGNGTGGSENNIYGEFSENGFANPISHTRGVISMARGSYDMNSASSQFFICQSDNHTASLDGKYAAFGRVTEGIEIVDKICTDAEPTDNNGTIPADKQPVITSLKIRAVDAGSY